MLDEELIDKIESSVIYIEDDSLYTINKHHTLIMKLKLQNKYPKMCFSTSNWVKGSKFYRDKEGKLRVREKEIVLKNDDETIRIPQNELNLKEAYDSLLKPKMPFFFDISSDIYKMVNKYSDAASFFKLEIEKDVYKISLYDTSKDRKIEKKTRSLVDLKPGHWYLPTTELNTLYKMGFENSKVTGTENYLLLKDSGREAILSSMKITE